MEEMTEEERRAAVKMLRDRAKEILNDPEMRCQVCNRDPVDMQLYKRQVCKNCRELLLSENERNQQVGYST